MPLANLRVITSPFNPLIVPLALSMMDLSSRRTSPGQSNDTIEIAPISTTQGLDNIHWTGVHTNDDPKVIWERQLLKEGSYLIADSLAQNSSKSAAVFRRYDKLAIHRLIVQSKELRGFEMIHDQHVDDISRKRDPEGLESGIHSEQFGLKIMEYCKR